MPSNISIFCQKIYVTKILTLNIKCEKIAHENTKKKGKIKMAKVRGFEIAKG